MYWPLDPPASSIAELFVDLYLEAGLWTASERAGAINPGKLFRRVVAQYLEVDDELQIISRLSGQYHDGINGDALARGRVLAILGAIDDTYYRVHPRAVVTTLGAGGRVSKPRWLIESRDRRTRAGSYIRAAGRLLVPRGPLLRGPRNANASSGDDLADRFAALSVVAPHSSVGETSIDIKLRVITSDSTRGVVSPTSPGRERVAFVPVAEDKSDLRCAYIDRHGEGYADFGPAHGFDPSVRMLQAIRMTGLADLVVAPEAVMPTSACEKVCEALRGLVGTKPNLILTGSGATEELSDGQPFNEARLVNAAGFEIARQRKLWPAGLIGDRARQCGLPDLGEKLILEDTASGKEVQVLDCDGFGRVVVLICQDMQARPFSDDLIRMYQPDWVLVPILDVGADVGRWAHQRAFELSGVSQARFVIVCSGTMAEWAGDTGPKRIGLAIGPKELSVTDDGQMNRAIAPVTTSSSNPALAAVVWGGDDWSQTTLAVK